jgi:hypothetical protein
MVNASLAPQRVAVYRGSMVNGTCDEYGIEASLTPADGLCAVSLVVDRLSAGPAGVCDAWVDATFTCNQWVLDGSFFPPCTVAELYVTQSFYGGSPIGETPAAFMT